MLLYVFVFYLHRHRRVILIGIKRVSRILNIFIHLCFTVVINLLFWVKNNVLSIHVSSTCINEECSENIYLKEYSSLSMSERKNFVFKKLSVFDLFRNTRTLGYNREDVVKDSYRSNLSPISSLILQEITALPRVLLSLRIRWMDGFNSPLKITSFQATSVILEPSPLLRYFLENTFRGGWLST